MCTIRSRVDRQLQRACGEFFDSFTKTETGFEVKSVAIKAVRGFKDILPSEAPARVRIEDTARQVFGRCGLKEIRTPVLEKTEVFKRGIGEHTDIVEKEMYTFQDRNGESLTLRPEATAGIVRAVVEHKLYGKSPLLKLFTMGPMFRHERPQKGRLRQFHQINVEYIGSQEPAADAEIVWLAWEIVTSIAGSEDLLVEMNSLGCEKCRPLHRADLKVYLENNKEDLCEDCQRRMKVNPLRIFDCKNEECRRNLMLAPVMKHYLCPDCAGHLGLVLDILEAYGVPFVQNPYLVRGLDYYVRTTFEITSKRLGAQSTVAAGGRYDGLVKLMGGPDLPGVGMAVGVERLVLLMEESVPEKAIDLFIAALGRDARDEAYYWIGYLRRQGISVEFSFEDKSLKAQMKQADKANARYCLIIGEQELENEAAIFRDMNTKKQEEIDLDDLPEVLIEKIRNQKPGE